MIWCFVSRSAQHCQVIAFYFLWGFLFLLPMFYYSCTLQEDTHLLKVRTFTVRTDTFLLFSLYIFNDYSILVPRNAHIVLTPYLLTPWSRILLEKLTSSQLVKKCSAFYGTRNFITAFTSARHLSLP